MAADSKYVVHCEDITQMFTYDSQWNEKSLYKRLVELQRRIDFVPGLVLQDENGMLWKPRLVVQLQRINPEETHG